MPCRVVRKIEKPMNKRMRKYSNQPSHSHVRMKKQPSCNCWKSARRVESEFKKWFTDFFFLLNPFHHRVSLSIF
jgi:hypothetical protein